jgi:hypothetical protein
MSTHPVRRPSKPRTGLSADYKITRGLAVWLYVCRHCGQRFQWGTMIGPFSELPPTAQQAIRDHAAGHHPCPHGTAGPCARCADRSILGRGFPGEHAAEWTARP